MNFHWGQRVPASVLALRGEGGDSHCSGQTLVFGSGLCYTSMGGKTWKKNRSCAALLSGVLMEMS